jgi:uncharacterized membrane protein
MAWEAEIVEQVPDKKISWRSIGGTPTAGTVVFEPIDEGHTRIMLTMEYEPQGLTQSVGSALGFDDRRVKGDLERFKEVVESRGVETGGYRCQIECDQIRRQDHLTAGRGAVFCASPVSGSIQLPAR